MKLRLLAQGARMTAADAIDLVLHAAPWAVLAASATAAPLKTLKLPQRIWVRRRRRFRRGCAGAVCEPLDGRPQLGIAVDHGVGRGSRTGVSV